MGASSCHRWSPASSGRSRWTLSPGMSGSGRRSMGRWRWLSTSSWMMARGWSFQESGPLAGEAWPAGMVDTEEREEGMEVEELLTGNPEARGILEDRRKLVLRLLWGKWGGTGELPGPGPGVREKSRDGQLTAHIHLCRFSWAIAEACQVLPAPGAAAGGLRCLHQVRKHVLTQLAELPSMPLCLAIAAAVPAGSGG
jgi:hypothetical protein